jgi:hypothetical protein
MNKPTLNLADFLLIGLVCVVSAVAYDKVVKPMVSKPVTK